MRRRALAALACATLLGGCESYGDLTSDAFDPGSAAPSTFTLDDADCAAQAELSRSDDIQAIAATHAERHEIFNRAYTLCMQRHGYARRDWSPDIALPYKIDPTPG
ncbi:MAG TPA: hypothetical protein VNU97_04125 [Rhizomicrobium sp.]|jgi:hypothetical protein|nr:hypothetical protein [Rhizomicrobium sp.]